MKLSVIENHPATEALASPAQPLVVLKFGSSILRGIEDLPRVAGEIYRQRRAGRRVIAVVSALAGETDRLLAEAASVTGGTCCRGVPDLVSQGEERTAALLGLACDRIGLPAALCRPEQLGLRTAGDPLAAAPTRIEAAELLARLAASGVVIVPGFVGIGDAGERTLLGRGGSDFSAVFIAGELGAECVRLYKDVDGVFDRDPATSDRARRFARISWADTLAVARPLIQPQAVEYAARKGLPIEVEAIGSSNPTLIGPCTGVATKADRGRPVRVALAGFGVVGQAVAERLRGERGFELVAILVRDPARERRVTAPVALTADLQQFLAVEADVVVDALSCEETGAFLCSAVLPKARHVVSASKRVISAGHGRFSRIAAANGVRILYSAAVGGSATVLVTVDRARAHGPVRDFVGILNGTVNFILDRLARGAGFDAALAEARAQGFAEEDSGFDLSGADAAAKLRLVARHALGLEPHALEVRVEALDTAALSRIAACGGRWVQVARLVAASSGSALSVTLQPLAAVAGMADATDEWNCAAVTIEDGRVFHAIGRGAGGAATAEAIVADLFDIASPDTAEVTPLAMAAG